VRKRPAVIVPTYDGAPLLADLLASLSQQTVDGEIVVVDNGSRDGTAEMVARRFPGVRTVSLPENLGFGKAVNRGVEASVGDPLVFVNNDAVCEPQFVERICGKLAAQHGVVMTAGVLVQADRPEIIDSAGIMFDRTLLAYDHLHGEPTSALRAAPDPLGPCGGAAAFYRDTFEGVGGFDEHFFAYLEDVDLVARLIARGGRCRLAAGARALHRHSTTLGSGSVAKDALMGWGRGYTLAKYRLHRQPGLFARALVGELSIAAGQLVIDRTAVGFQSRIVGFRAGLAVTAERLPTLPEAAARITLREVLGRRLKRMRPSGRVLSESPAQDRSSSD
jgi:N-acetylglucosaminyl-diphospho-decaprenol L-rhamnosyltransferase